MTPRERWLRCMRGEPVDRVPLHLEGLHYASREQLAAEPDALRRDVADRIFDQTHFEVHAPAHVNRYLITPRQFMREVGREQQGDAEIATGEIRTPKGSLVYRTGRNPGSHTTWQVKYPVESLADIEKIRSVPWELPAGLRAPDLREWPAGFAERGIVQTGISSPFVCVAAMMPYEYFLELCITEFALIRELTALCLERTLAVLDAVLAERSVEYVWMGGCEWLTPPMGSPHLYEELVQVFEEPIIRRVHDAGAVMHVHCHGNVRSTLARVIARGGDYFEPVEPPPDGDIPFAEAKELAAGRMTLGGNLEARVLEYGSAAEVEAATRLAFAGSRERMVLRNSAGPIAAWTETIHRNYHRMLDVWEACAQLEPVEALSGSA